jgi:hypothetical protein
MAVIDIRIQTLEQLFDSLDPSPFHDKALHRDAEAYLVECAGEFPAQEALELRIHAPQALAPRLPEIERAVHSHFLLAHARAERQLRWRMRLGRMALAVGLLVLAGTLLLRRSLIDQGGYADLIGESLLVLGWVALWRPIEMLLFDRLESRAERARLRKLAAMPVRLQAAD